MAVQVIEIEEGADLIFSINGVTVAIVESTDVRQHSSGNGKFYGFVGHGIEVGERYNSEYRGSFASGGAVTIPSLAVAEVKVWLENANGETK